MPDTFIFADEAGDFTFNRQPNVSKYFIVCTVTMDDCAIAADLLRLRRLLAWEGHELGDHFHATTDRQSVRDAVYETVLRHPFSIQATIVEKCKARPEVRETRLAFYRSAFFYHFKYGVTAQLHPRAEALVTTASLGTRRERAMFEDAVADVMRQTNKVKDWRTDFLPSQADPCLQVADYCAWALQRKWESRGRDCRSYDLIKQRITYEYDLFGTGSDVYY